MPQPHTLRISEIFSSVQGEGLRQGEPTHFIRLTGCNLSCSFCDTKYAWSGGRSLSIDEILRRLDNRQKKFPADWACLTGGEPFFQDLRRLVGALKDRSYRVQIETNGSLYQDLSPDWLTVSPKPPDFEIHPAWRRRADEIKLVVSREVQLDMILKLRDVIPPAIPLLLQPQSQRVWSRKKALVLLRQAALKGRRNIRISLQLHKILAVR